MKNKWSWLPSSLFWIAPPPSVMSCMIGDVTHLLSFLAALISSLSLFFDCSVWLCKPFLGAHESVASPVPPSLVNTEILLHASECAERPASLWSMFCWLYTEGTGYQKFCFQIDCRADGQGDLSYWSNSCIRDGCRKMELFNPFFIKQISFVWRLKEWIVQAVILSVIDDGDILYLHANYSPFKMLDLCTMQHYERTFASCMRKLVCLP